MSAIIYNIFLTSGLIFVLTVIFIVFVGDMDVSLAVKQISVSVFLFSLLVFLASAFSLIWI